MPIGPNGEKRPSDPIQAAVMVAKIATGEIEEEYVDKPTPTPERAKGGRIGGKARANSLSRERRSEIAKQGASKRWNPPS